MNTETLPPATEALLALRHLSHRFGSREALQNIDLAIPEGRIVGLLGRNGAGKSTLLNIASGLLLPSSGSCELMACPSAKLGAAELTQLGYVPQEPSLLEWMRVRQHLEFTASFYPSWDKALESRLLELLELDPSRKIFQLSVGDRQKLAIVLAVCHRPRLLLLDEPMSALDPIVRQRLLDFLVERLREDGATILISSHILHDIEKILDWVVALDAGRLVVDAAFDELQESYAAWSLESRDGKIPAHFSEDFVLTQKGQGHQAVLQVRLSDPAEQAAFVARHGVELRSRALTLEEMFPLFTGDTRK